MSVIFTPFYNSVSRLHYKAIPKGTSVKGWILQHWGLVSETTPLLEKECVTWEDQIFAQNTWKTQSHPQGKGRKLETQKSPTGQSHWLNTSFACFPQVLSLSVMKESVRCSALFTKQWRYEKLTNSGVNLYSGGIVSSRSPAFFSFFSLAFALKEQKKSLRKIKIKTRSTFNFTIKILQRTVWRSTSIR